MVQDLRTAVVKRFGKISGPEITTRLIASIADNRDWTYGAKEQILLWIDPVKL